MPFGLVIVGAGPGGLAPLFAAASDDRLQAMLDQGVVVLERSSSLGPGRLHEYSIGSDSTAEAFLDILTRTKEPSLQALLTHPIALDLEARRGDTAPLLLAAQLQEIAGEALCAVVDGSPKGQVLCRTEMLSVHRVSDTLWEVRTRNVDSDEEQTFVTRSVHLATGAHQPHERLHRDPVAGVKLLPRYENKLIQSGELFTTIGTERLIKRLAGTENPRIAIVGGSTSAGSAAVLLLRRTPIPFGDGGVTILHRDPLRLFYNSAKEANADGYTDFTETDICHISGRVYRLSGFRGESKDLIRSALRVNGRRPDPRLRLVCITDAEAEAQKLLERADVIITAIGYRPRMCDVFDSEGHPIALHEPTTANWAVVDQQSRVLAANGTPLAGLTAMGLAIGPAASYEMGGEANFHGQVNSLWLWQNRLGLNVVASALERCKPTKVPLMRPAPPRLSQHMHELEAIEHSNTYSNFGPMVRRFESELVDTVFGGEGYALTTCNATIALMIAMRNAVGFAATGRRYALMPSFTFAAAAQAALWCRLTPLYCDIDPNTWLPCGNSEEELLEKYGNEIAIIVPNATFGNNLDLPRYEKLSQRYGIPVVVDGAASLGSLDRRGTGFGSGSSLPVVFSMHATKTFATGEGGVIYSGDKDLIDRLRVMSSFGFAGSRVATIPGLNAKMSEVAGLTALLQLRELPAQAEERQAMSQRYGIAVDEHLKRQHTCGKRQVRTFESVLLPEGFAPLRARLMARMQEEGITTGTYFSPHLAQQPFLGSQSLCPPLPVSDDIASRILTLPLYHGMMNDEIDYVCEHLLQAVHELSPELVMEMAV